MPLSKLLTPSLTHSLTRTHAFSSWYTRTHASTYCGTDGKLSKLYERPKTEGKEKQQPMLMKGQESIIFDYDDDDDNTFSMYTLTEDGNLIQLSNIEPKQAKNSDSDETDGNDLVATTTVIANLGNGRPLGGCFVPKTASTNSDDDDDNDDDSTTTTSTTSSTKSRMLYIADAVLGLTRITLHKNKDNKTLKTSKVEIVTTTAYDPETSTMTKINFADDVVVGPKTGTVYFTDGTWLYRWRSV